MFSSRILREGNGRPYLLKPLGGTLAQPQREGFRPVHLGGEELPEAVEPEPVEVAVPAPPAMMLEEEALALVRQARAEGVQEGRTQAEAELAAALHALTQALSGVAALQVKLLHEAEDDLLKLSALIARKVMLRELSCDPAILAGLVRGALDVASDGGEVIARLSPEEYAVVAQCPEFQELLRDNPRVAVKPDPAVGRAGCLLETPLGNIDAGIEAQLDEIMRRLMEEKSARHEDDPGE